MTHDDLVKGENCFFSATGVTDGDVLAGVRYEGARGATTESLVMRSRSGTVRRIAVAPRPHEAARADRLPATDEGAGHRRDGARAAPRQAPPARAAAAVAPRRRSSSTASASSPTCS